jgi:hypothetical protein
MPRSFGGAKDTNEVSPAKPNEQINFQDKGSNISLVEKLTD